MEWHMNTLLKILVCVLFLVIIGLTGLIGYVKLGLPKSKPAPNLKVKSDPETLKRGEYLATHVAGCLTCHSKRDFSRFSGPVDPALEGAGGEEFTRPFGTPGDFPAPNLTPAHLGEWTDGEIYRAITAGVSRNGEPLFPVMPYNQYGQLDDEDIHAIIAYIRTLPSKETSLVPRTVDFPFSLILRTIPKPPTPGKRPPASDTVKYGEYLTKAASCFDCHTRMVDNKRLPENAFGGDFEFKLPDGATVHSANITPDMETGIGKMTKEQFIARFKAYEPGKYQPAAVKSGEPNTLMPWTKFAGMKEEDLSAIYDYLRTVKPIKRTIVRYQPPGAHS